MVKSEFALVKINPSKESQELSDWGEKIKENFGGLSGYVTDLNNGKTIDSILLDILNIKSEENNSYINYENIKNIYLEHIKSLQENLDKEDDTLKREISALQSASPTQQVVDVLKKYGILTGIEFFIPYEKIYRSYEDFMGENVYKGGDNPFKKLKFWEETISISDYVPKKGFEYSDISLSVQVYIFSKVKAKLINITNFISSVETNVTIGSGGNFNIKMNLASPEELEKESNFQDNNISITGYSKALFLQSIFRENDLVFIKFEKLKVENDGDEVEVVELDDSVARAQAKRERKVETIKKKIKGKYWDMIGLIDTTSIGSSYNNIEIKIIGRDLIKLLIEDYNFFIPIQFGNTPETIFGGGNSKIFKRLFTSGEYNLEFTRSFRSIQNSIGFILSQLTNTQILSDSCLEFLKKEYGNDLSKQFEFTEEGEKKEKKTNINGIWGLVNYFVDDNIVDLRLADASLKSPDGSVLQQIHKACQTPFVEIIADTFVDKYSLYLRRPPFTMEDISKQKFIVIEREETISEELEFNQEIYTIFQLNPQGGCFVNNNSIPLSYLPMVVLEEYTKLWGNKLYSQIYNYTNIDTYLKISKNDKEKHPAKEKFVDALIWLIETTAYLPFSRTGSIVIKGDRRIKAGQWIYFEKSNEIFYVDGVQNSISVSENNLSRTTTLKVSRGLVKDYVSPKRTITRSQVFNESSNEYSKAKTVSNVSYGDLVDIEYLREGLKELFVKLNKNFTLNREQTVDNKLEKTDSIVIKEVFNFFLSGAQFEGKVKSYVLRYNESKSAAISLKELKDKDNNSNNQHNDIEVKINGSNNPNDVDNQSGDQLRIKKYNKPKGDQNTMIFS